MPINNAMQCNPLSIHIHHTLLARVLKMAAKSIISTSYLALLIISLVSISESTSVTGFTTDLIHRDSPLSPFYDPSSTPSQRLTNALQRSVHRARRFNNQLAEDPQPDLIPAGGEYLLNFSIGTPPVPTLAIADTGSDIVWTQCQPCTDCFTQSLPRFNPQNSASYAGVPCGSTTCNSLPETADCTTAEQNCLYSTRYGDGTYTEGVFATESFTFASAGGKAVIIPHIVFGCVFLATGISTGKDSGIVGLGGGRASLVRQLGQGKFSYCLVPQFQNSVVTNSGKLSFGGEAEVSGGEAVSTPLVVKKGEGETFYFMTMEGISVGETRIEFYDSSSSGWRSVREGNIVIDSRTPLTRLPESLYAEVEEAIKSQTKLKQITHPRLLCFETGGDIGAFPKIRVHLRGGDLMWGFENAFVNAGKNSVCLAALATGEDEGVPPIYGNIAQANFLVGYDLDKKTVSFKPAHCGA